MTIIHYELPDELHRALKVRAAQEGSTLKQTVIDALSAYLLIPLPDKETP